MAKIRILLIEDNRLLREGIAAMLNAQSYFEVDALAEDGDIVEQLKKMKISPDIILLNLGLKKETSLNLMAGLMKELQTARFIAMDMFPEQSDIIEFVKAGGSGFILKTASLEDYIQTIKRVAEGEDVLPTALTNSLFTEIIQAALKTGNGIPKNSMQLTSRELDVTTLITEGLGNKEIAERLYISTYTVKSHVHNILEKLALNTRLQIAAFVREKDSER
ncbi:MAG: response regulator transcription factor [Candidatus Krumholzibacteriota bacterium]|nr:response regulator transcription factor [Candidatus Krumholzibacteriota bacterium]